MDEKTNTNFEIHQTQNADVLSGLDRSGWRLLIPPGSGKDYRLAQLDDHSALSRDHLRWQPPVKLNLRARVSAPDVPGTWGFGFWNDPFSLSLGLGGGSRRFPALPNAAWFFFASPQSYLSFCDHLPAFGFIAQTFRSPGLPEPLLALGIFGLPALIWPWLARVLRSFFRNVVAEDSYRFNSDVTKWQSYTLEWRSSQVTFGVSGQKYETRIVPNGPLGFVLWIDNQYLAFPPDGKFSYGTLPYSKSACLEIEALSIERG